ncbi:hypothetical protein FA13DRAFT_1718544 [Coprinellus micaceus]|uniref:Uncharacterized protein n=1 Tax=Coprinellus micaceus TaxID=71717 RepID=A0A4Y7SF74_COPMI|nr:hypothetical protein FA13DRAFT_1718544 [Coprinellus micaceus]
MTQEKAQDLKATRVLEPPLQAAHRRVAGIRTRLMNTAFTDECGKRYAECATTFGTPGGNDARFEQEREVLTPSMLVPRSHFRGTPTWTEASRSKAQLAQSEQYAGKHSLGWRRGAAAQWGYLKCGLSGTNLMTVDEEETAREDRGALAVSANLNLKHIRTSRTLRVPERMSDACLGRQRYFQWGWSPGARPAVTEHFDVRHGSGHKSHLEWAERVDVLEIGELGADVARVRKEPEIRQIEDDQMSPHITGGRVHAQKCAREGQGARERFAQVPCRTIALILFHPFPAGAAEQAAPAIPRRPTGTRPLSGQAAVALRGRPDEPVKHCAPPSLKPLDPSPSSTLKRSARRLWSEFFRCVYDTLAISGPSVPTSPDHVHHLNPHQLGARYTRIAPVLPVILRWLDANLVFLQRRMGAL